MKTGPGILEQDPGQADDGAIPAAVFQTQEDVGEVGCQQYLPGGGG